MYENITNKTKTNRQQQEETEYNKWNEYDLVFILWQMAAF